LRVVLALRWSLSREAAVAAGLVAAAEADEPVLELLAPWAGRVEGVRAILVRGGDRDELALEGAPAGAWIEDEAGGLRHLDLSGVLRVTARPTDTGVEVLYARTEVLGRLGLAGGRYDFVGAALRMEADGG
jgi:hypothetical protein